MRALLALFLVLASSTAGAAQYAVAVSGCDAVPAAADERVVVLEVTPSTSECAIDAARRFGHQVVLVTRSPRVADVLSGIVQGNAAVLAVGPGVDAEFVAAEIDALADALVDAADDDDDDDFSLLDAGLPGVLVQLCKTFGWRVL